MANSADPFVVSDQGLHCLQIVKSFVRFGITKFISLFSNRYLCSDILQVTYCNTCLIAV